MDKTLTYGALALVGTEATGITNFTGGSGSGGPIQMPGMPDIKMPEIGQPNLSLDTSGGGVSDGLLAAVAGNQNSGPISDSIGQITDMQSTINDLQTQIQNQDGNGQTSPLDPSWWQNQIPDPSDIPGTPEIPDMPNGPTPTQPGNPNSGGSGDLDLQDYGTPGDGNMGMGDYAAILGESGHALGQPVNDTINTLTKTGNTLGETTKALTGQEYNTEGTFANNGNSESRRLYQGNLIPDVNVPDINLPNNPLNNGNNQNSNQNNNQNSNSQNNAPPTNNRNNYGGTAPPSRETPTLGGNNGGSETPALGGENSIVNNAKDLLNTDINVSNPFSGGNNGSNNGSNSGSNPPTNQDRNYGGTAPGSGNSQPSFVGNNNNSGGGGIIDQAKGVIGL